jgi:hypothetical protein
MRQPSVSGMPRSRPFCAVLKWYRSSVMLDAVRTKTMLPYELVLETVSGSS